MTPEMQNIFFPSLGGLLLILLSIIAWFAVSLAKRWEESHKHHYANNNEIRQHVIAHNGRIKTVEKKIEEHKELFADLEDDFNDLTEEVNNLNKK